MDIQDTRRRNLRTLIDTEYGGISRHLAQACGKPEGQINDMLSAPPRKSFGEKIARQIERQLGLEALQLDRSDGDPTAILARTATNHAYNMAETSAASRHLPAAEPPTSYVASSEEQELLDGYRRADAGLKRSLLLLARDAIKRSATL